jgi:hypothetical protein
MGMETEFVDIIANSQNNKAVCSVNAYTKISTLSPFKH